MAEIIVYNFADFKTATLDAAIETVYLGADINIGTGGILLPKNKPLLVIDGIDPEDETKTMHTITDINSDINQAIRVAAVAGAFQVTLKNCVVIGRNLYGILAAVLSSTNQYVIFELENVEFSGPQAIYNIYGETRAKNCRFRIGKYNGTSAAVNELCESNIVVFSGEVDIYHDGTPNSCIWLTSTSPVLTLTEGSKVTVETTSREFIYNDNAAAITLKQNSSLILNTHWGMFWSNGMNARSLVLEERAELVINQAVNNSGVASLHCSGNMSLAPDSRLIILRRFTSAEPLIRFSATATASFDNPKSVVLYNRNGRLFNWTSGTGTLDITAGQINYWLVAEPDLNVAGGFDDIPLYQWMKADGSPAWIRANVSSTATSNIGTNIIEGTDAPVAPTSTTFNMQNARVLSFGSLPLDINRVVEFSDTISGVTDPAAAVRAIVSDVETETVASGDGSFSVLLAVPMSRDTTYTVLANIDFKTVKVSAYAEGELSFLLLPDRLPFTTRALPIRSEFVTRANPDWKIVIRDSRLEGGEWYLYAQVNTPLSTDTDTLDDAMIMKESATISVLGTQPVKIFTGEPNGGDIKDTAINWSELEGLLLQLVIAHPYQPGHYTTDISFILSEEEL